jgi:hypothetical protein
MVADRAWRIAFAGTGLLAAPRKRLYISRRLKSAHRLAVQDAALSRRKRGFDSPWARQLFQ